MIKVKLLNGDAYWMAFYADADGNTWLDLDDNFEIKYSKEIETLTDIDKINVEAILGTSLVATPKNEALIGKPAMIGVFHNVYDDYEIQLCIGLKIFNQSTLRILSKSESLKPGDNPHYEIEILDESKHWAVQLNKMYLDELDFPDFEYSPDNLWNSFNIKYKYQDGDEGYWFPLVNYGQWFNNRKYMVSDFRPWVHDLKVFQLAFKKAEWQFNCPLLESDLGRRLISYVLKERFYTDEIELKFAEFKAVHKKDKWYNGGKKPVFAPVIFENELLDKSNSYDPTTGKFTGIGKFKFQAEFTANLVISNKAFAGNASVILEFVKVLANGSEVELGGYAKFEKLSYVDYFEKDALITIYTEEINLFAGESIYVRFRGHSKEHADVYIKSGSVFYNEPLAKIYDTGDVLKFSKALRHDKVLDFVKGCAHLFNFKFYTNFPEKKVYILTPYDVNFFGDNLTGFFQDTLADFTNYIDLTDTEIKVPQEEKKNIYYKFKESKDPFIEALKLDKDKDLFSNFIDKGYDFEDETIKEENPYFEPTANNIEQTKSSLFDMPVCLDNLDGKLSFNINPRKLIAAGMVDQDNYQQLDYFGEAGDNNAPYVGQYVTPYAYQLANAAVFNGSTYAKVTEYLIYGKDQYDLYNLFYKKYNNEFQNCQSINLDTFANYDKIESIDFRKRILVHINGTSQYGRFLAVNGYDPDKRDGKILFKPDNTSDPISSLYTSVNKCENYPDILITANGGESYTISATGTNASTLASTTIQWRYFDTPTWTTGATFSTTSKKVYCRITWVYSDGCPNIVRTGTIEPCGNYPKVCAERSFPEPYTLNVYECGSHSDTIVGYLYEYSVNNIAWQVIPDPFLLADLPENVWLRVTVYYANCEPKTAELQYTNIASADDCTYDGLYVPSLAFATTPAGLVVERKGFFTGKVAADIIWVRKVGTNDEWDLYNDRNQEVLDTNNGINWEAYRVVMFCNEDCPIYCSDVVTANNNCAGSVAIVDSSILTDFTMKWEHPDTPGSLTWKAVINNDESTFVPKIKVFVDQHDMGHTYILERSVEWHEWSFKTEFLWTWAQTDSVKLLKISRNVAGTQTLGLNLDIGVKFETGATNDELKTLLENAIFTKMFDVYGAVNGTHYKLIVTITGSGSSRSAGVSFQSKKVVADTWYGAYATSDYLQTETVGHTTTNYSATKKEFQEVTTPAPTITIWTPCGNPLTVKFKVNTSTQFVNDASSNFDNIVMNGTISIVDEVITSITDICQQHMLSLTISGCTSPIYVWKKGRKILGTGATVTTWGNNTIKAIVGCNDNCYYKTEVVQ